ncbi:MAG: DedA family protein [Planctomycetes bacterium]|nr:DedA family protein [Planctomycetota bacterium]
MFDHVSYLGIIVILVLTGCGLPLPEEVPIVAAGIASSVGKLNPWWAFFSCLLGALGGDAVLYAIGYHFGHSLITRHPRFAHLLHAEREAGIEQMIRRHEVKVFFLSRFMVGVRAPVFLAAGVLRIPFYRFLIIDAFCATTVVGLIFGLSYAYGDRLTSLIRQSEIWLTVTVALVVCAAVCFYFWKRRRRNKAATPQSEDADREACAVGTEGTREL